MKDNEEGGTFVWGVFLCIFLEEQFFAEGGLVGAALEAMRSAI